MNAEAHIRVKFIGKAEKIRAANYILGRYDCDWPLAPVEVRRPGMKPTLCEKCGGFIYKNGLVDADKLRALVHQVHESVRLAGNLSVKIKKFTVGGDCATAPDVDVDDPTTSVTVEVN